MGGKCFKTTPAQAYAESFQTEILTALKEQWPPIRLFKLKHIFETSSSFHQQRPQRQLSYTQFVELILEFNQQKFNSYSNTDKKRIFDLFDRSGNGFLSWNNFFMGLTLCYYGSQEILSIFIFAIFDQHLKKRLTRQQVADLLNKNSKYLLEDSEEGEPIDQQDIISSMMSEQDQQLSLETWVNQSHDYLDYQKFRKMFNIFVQQEMEEDMAQNFTELNNLYSEQRNRYVGYLVTYKWFQSWKTYIHKQYNICINGFSDNLTYIRTMRTLKSMKTKKTIRSIKSVKSMKSSKSINSLKNSKKTTDWPKLKQIHDPYKSSQSKTVQYNLIHSNIGDKPAEIYNNLLEGEHSEILMPQLIQNINYILVSEEVWKRLKMIYSAYPQFRRTGQKSIQIYPKLFRIFSKFQRGKIDYKEERVCQFSKFMQLNHLIAKAFNFDVQQMNNLYFFFKTCSNHRWEQIIDTSLKAADISSDQLVFLAVVPHSEAQQFRQINCKIAENIRQVHIGDQLLYTDPLDKTSIRAVFMGKNKDKMVVHFKGLSYIYDICIEKEEFYSRSTLNRRALQLVKNRVKIEQLQMIGLPSAKGLGFVNCLLLTLFSNEQLTKRLIMGFKDQPNSLKQSLGNIYHMLTNCTHATTALVSDMIRIYFSEFVNFEFTMCEMFVEQLLQSLRRCWQVQQTLEENPAQQYLIQTEKVVNCQHCHRSSSQRESFFTLALPIPQEDLRYYQVIYVPYAYSLKGTEMRRYGFTLANKSTLEDYKEMFERVAELKDTTYMLAEVHGNNIIKNYLNARNDALLDDLLLREDDHIFAYELCFKIDNFVCDRYCNDTVVKFRNLKIGQMIDFQREYKFQKKTYESRKKVKIQNQKSFVTDKGDKTQRLQKNDKIWAFGRIVKIQIQSYTHKLILNVEYRESRTQIVEVKLNPEENPIALFPTRCYRYSEQYHIRTLQRFYNQVSNQMQLIGMPLVVMVATWMRLKQVELIVYQQVRQMIHDDYKFNLAEDNQQEQKIGRKEKAKKFRQYLYGGNVPYTITFTDLEGRCSICCKIHKSQVLASEEQYICSGCPIDADLPIFWQLRPYQTRICVDWRAADACLKPSVTDHSSYIATKSARKNCVQQLDECIQQRIYQSQNQDCCCSYNNDKQLTSRQTFNNCPQRLLITLDRLIQQQHNYKHINKKYIHFQIDEMTFQDSIYQLTAAISIDGSQLDARYTTYIRQKNHWLQYNGEHVRVVKKNTVQKICALCLHYRKIVKGTDKTQKKNVIL